MKSDREQCSKAEGKTKGAIPIQKSIKRNIKALTMLQDAADDEKSREIGCVELKAFI